jgi:APA family basic amino acid/polyamine antiporter
MATKKIFRIDKGTLKRSLKTIDVFAVGYGDLGSSIYYALGITAFYALGATPIALMLAGFVFVLTALTYAEMSSVVPESGGSASFSRKSFNDLISFFAGWALLLDYIVTIAISAFSVGPYLKYFFPYLGQGDWNIPFTVILITVLLLINIVGTRHATRVSVFLTITTILTQFVIIIFGIFTIVNFSAFFKSIAIGVQGSTVSPSWSQFFKGVAMAMVAYTGIESMAQMGSESKKPEKTVPRAMWIVTVVLIASYLGLSIVALSAMHPNALATTYVDDPVAGITTKLPYIGKWMSSWIGLLGGIILFAAANSGILGASRVAFNLGEYCQLPKFFYVIHPRFKTPIVSLSIFAVLSSAIVVWSRGSLSFLADLYNFGAQLSFLSAHLALIMHRVQFPDVKRPFKLWFNLKIKGKEIPVTAILGAILTLSVWLMVVITKKDGRELGLFWMFLGFIFYAALRRKYKIGITESVEIKHIKMGDFEKMDLKKILVLVKKGVDEENIKVACEIASRMKAELVALYVSEIPYAIPLSVGMKRKSKIVEEIFEIAEAVGKEYQVPVYCRQVVARSTGKAVADIANEEEFDLVVLSTSDTLKKRLLINEIVEQVIEEANCKVWVCRKEKL